MLYYNANKLNITLFNLNLILDFTKYIYVSELMVIQTIARFKIRNQILIYIVTCIRNPYTYVT